MSGKSPICEADLLQALSASLEPRFPASAVTASDDAAVQFLVERGVLPKDYHDTVLCTGCQEGCEVPVQADGNDRFIVCPTGYVERRIPVSDDELTARRFDFAAFRAGFAKENGLRVWADDRGVGPDFHTVAHGRRAGKRIIAIYTLRLDCAGTAAMLHALKDQLRCDRLVVLTPQPDHCSKETLAALATGEIRVVALGDLLGQRTFDIDVAEPGEAAPPSNAFCRVVTHEGREFLTQQQYQALVAKRQEFDMFIDAFEKKCWNRRAPGKTTEARLTAAELHVLCSYIEAGKVAKPTRFGSSIKVFETARKKADVNVSRYEWRAFTTHQTPGDPEMKEYQFTPPSGLRFCLVTPLS